MDVASLVDLLFLPKQKKISKKLHDYSYTL